MAENKKINIVEGIYDLFDKNIDPLVLKDRLNQAARARDLARSAAKRAEELGKTDLASQLNADADRLQQVIDLTKQSANIAHGDQGDSDSSASQSANANTSSTTGDMDEDDAPFAQGDMDDDEAEPLDPDDSDEDLFDDSSEDDSEDENSDGDESDDSSPDSGSEDSDDQDEEAAAKDSDNSDSSDSSEAEGDDDEDSDASADSEEDTDEDGSSYTDDEEYDDNAFGSPKVEDNTILQDPFKNGQIQPELPKDIADGLASGDLQIEPELEAIVRIVSKLKGEARRGAEQALKDYYGRENPWGDIEREDD